MTPETPRKWLQKAKTEAFALLLIVHSFLIFGISGRGFEPPQHPPRYATDKELIVTSLLSLVLSINVTSVGSIEL